MTVYFSRRNPRDSAGANGFGYDPLFYYAPFGRTFGETEPDAKMGVSHRGLALKAMLEALRRGAATTAR